MSTTLINSVDLSGYAPEDRAVLEQALEMATERGWSASRFASAVFQTTTVLQRVYQGKYEGRSQDVVQDIRRWVEAERFSTLIETDVTRQYKVVLNGCRRDSVMGVIVARTGRGKTLTCRTWEQTQPPGSVVMVQVPSRCTRADLVRLLCNASGVSTDTIKEPEQERELFSKITLRHMVIVDEAGYLVQQRRQTSPLRLLQDLHDSRRCPIVLTMRPPQWAQLVAGRGYRDDEQLIGRLLRRCIVTDRFLRSEIETILRRFVNKIDDSLRKEVRDSLARDDGGLRSLVPDLARAREHASDTGIGFADAFVEASAYRSIGGDWDPVSNPTF